MKKRQERIANRLVREIEAADAQMAQRGGRRIFPLADAAVIQCKELLEGRNIGHNPNCFCIRRQPHELIPAQQILDARFPIKGVDPPVIIQQDHWMIACRLKRLHQRDLNEQPEGS